MNLIHDCSEALLQQFLEHRLSSDQEQGVMTHLESCKQCQNRLESLAGDRSWWQEVGEHLRPDGASTGWSLGTPAAGPLTGATLRQIQALLAPSEHPEMLGRLGNYEIKGLIGRGGAGFVLKALDPTLNRWVAIKLLLPHWADHASARERFAREARAAAAVVNDHVVPIYAVDQYQGLPYLVMQYVTGGSLEQRLRSTGPQEIVPALRIALQTALALAAAHAQGLVHRDIKPANILLEPNVDRVRVADFGLARSTAEASLTCSGFVAGTPRYMSPEQARGEAVDPRSDLFGLGCVLYELLSGAPPFQAETLVGVLHQVCEVRHRPLTEVAANVPGWLSALVDKLLTKDPAERFPSAAALSDVITAELAHLQNPLGIAAPDRSSYLPRTLEGQRLPLMWARPRRRLAHAGIALASLLAVSLLMVATQHVVVRWWSGVQSSSAGESPSTVKPPTSTPAAPSGSVLLTGQEMDLELIALRANLEQLKYSLAQPTAPLGPDEWLVKLRHCETYLANQFYELSREPNESPLFMGNGGEVRRERVAPTEPVDEKPISASPGKR